MSMTQKRNIGALLAAGGEVSIPTVAGGAASGNVDGASIDRLPAGSSQRHDSAVIIGALIGSSLAAAQTGTLTTIVQHSDDNAAFTDFATLDDVVVTGGGVESDSAKLDVNLLGAKRYIRTRQTLTVSAGAGSASFGGCVVLSAANLPA